MPKINELPAAASAEAGYIVAADNPSLTQTQRVTLGQIAALAAGSAPVQSVAGKTGNVTLAVENVANAVATSDSRLSDARTPLSHVHSGADITTGSVAVGRLPTVLEQQVAVGNSGTATTLSLLGGSFQTVTLNGNCTFTMPAAAAGASITLVITQSGTFTATFTGVAWPGGLTPTITATANKKDIAVFVSDGTNWYGSIAQNF